MIAHTNPQTSARNNIITSLNPGISKTAKLILKDYVPLRVSHTYNGLAQITNVLSESGSEQALNATSTGKKLKAQLFWLSIHYRPHCERIL
jgi:hypothetical protein